MNTSTMNPRRGLSLAEMLIAGSICAMLLLSIAMAYDASAQSITENDRFSRAAQIARISVRNLVEECRKAEACQVGPTSMQSQTVIENQSTLDVIRPDGTVVKYSFDASDGILRLTIDDPVTPLTAVLARDVTMCRFSGEVEPHPDTGIRRTVRVMVELKVGVQSQSLYLTGAAVPRREMVYTFGE